MIRLRYFLLAGSLLSVAAISPASAHEGHTHIVLPESAGDAVHGEREWLAGDHHIHSEFSAEYEIDPANPDAMPAFTFGVDGIYPIQRNAEMAREFGLAWMVSTDHGGPGHSRINHDFAYPSLLESRQAVPQVLQFFGMEFDTPDGDHSSLIIPRTEAERSQLFEIEAGYSRREAHPTDPARDEPARMIAALTVMRDQPQLPVLIANHPSRSAVSATEYGRYDPAEFRNWNDTAPSVAVGMEGAPGHQAAALNPDGTADPQGYRGGYRQGVPTMGGFDPMTARVGGLWDAMLAEGRRWWVTATSDSHRHWREGGSDFWPGEYSKTYVHAARNYTDILDGLRNGRVFVTTGDLVSSVDMEVRGSGTGGDTAGLGGMVEISADEELLVQIRVRDPQASNAGGHNPALARIDLVGGPITGPVADRSQDRAPETRVLARFIETDWRRDGEYISITYSVPASADPYYLRVRGTNGTELEPAEDLTGEDPRSDLWFYANPVFVNVIQ